jgi:hypothetical protein
VVIIAGISISLPWLAAIALLWHFLSNKRETQTLLTEQQVKC